MYTHVIIYIYVHNILCTSYTYIWTCTSNYYTQRPSVLDCVVMAPYLRCSGACNNYPIYKYRGLTC